MIDFGATALAAAAQAFGETVQYYGAATGPRAVTAIFNDRYQQTKFDDGVEVVDIATVLGARAAQFPVQPRQGDRFVVRGVLYVVTDVDADGMGDLKVTLRAASNAEAARMRLPPGA